MNKKLLQQVICIGSALFLFGCSTPATPAASATPVPPTATVIPPSSTPAPTSTSTPTLAPTSTPTEVMVKISTSLGDILLTKAEIASENPMGEKAQPGYQILNVLFKSADGKQLDGMAFYNASKAVYVEGDDGSRTNSYMGGLVSGELMVGFTPPASAHEFTLFWPGNDPIKLELTQ